jgi:hypothetical protein
LLDRAKRAVEIAIEKNEAAGMKLLKNEILPCVSRVPAGLNR